MSSLSSQSQQYLDQLRLKYANQSLVSTRPCDIPRELGLDEDVEIERILHAYNINDFYILTKKDTSTLSDMEEMLSSLLSFNQDFYHPGGEDMTTQIAVYNYEPQKWKRLKITDFLPDGNVKVFYIDYGTIEIIKLRNLRVLPVQAESYPPFAIYCSLDVVPMESVEDDEDDDPSDDLTNFLRNKLCDESAIKSRHVDCRVKARCIRKITRKNGLCHVVILHHYMARDWASELVDSDWAARKQYNGPEQEAEELDKALDVSLKKLAAKTVVHDMSYSNLNSGTEGLTSRIQKWLIKIDNE